MRALLIIDVQLDFLPGGALAVPGGNEIIAGINHIQPLYELVIATQDWHPPTHKSFASNHPGKKPFEKIVWMGSEQVLWPDHCVQESPGASFPIQLEGKRIEAIFRKGTNPEMDSYSGFFDNGHVKSTGLSAFLKGRQVTELHLVGLAGDYCVYFSAKDALAQGFRTIFIEDLTRAIDPAGFDAAKKDIVDRGGEISNYTTISAS